MDGSWGRVCKNQNWGNVESSVVCKQLDLSSQGITIEGNEFGTGRGRYHLQDIECAGSEESIFDCFNTGYLQRTCYSWIGDVGVRCSGEYYVIIM